ncbi:MAG: hypothetical protein WA584_10410 [Pyrinomonadaceae bacterium]
MKSIIKLSRKFILLGAMLFALGFVVSTDFGTTEVAAAPCCSICEDYYDNCIALGHTPEYCLPRQESCWRYCNPYC